MLRAQSGAIITLLIVIAGIAAWASKTWSVRTDLTWTHANSLSPPSLKVLRKLQKPVKIMAFVRPHTPLSRAESALLNRYQRADPKVHVIYLNPDTSLPEMRSLGIHIVGELYLQYGRRSIKLTQINQFGVTNALLRLARDRHPIIIFSDGNGEASVIDQGNYGYSRFAKNLVSQGFRVRRLNLGTIAKLPKSTSVLVIASPRSRFLPTETRVVKNWIRHGGNLLWLHAPGPSHGLKPIARRLGLQLFNGTLVDATSVRLGINNPTWIVETRYPRSPITKNFSVNTLFPDTTGFKLRKNRFGWKSRVLLYSRRLPDSWLIPNPLPRGTVTYVPSRDTPGPLPIAVAFTRDSRSPHQRLVVIGNSYFLANSFIGDGGNLQLGLNIVNWLAHDDSFVNVGAVISPDRHLLLSTAEQAGIGLGFLVALPVTFLCIALGLWLRRRNG